MAYFSNDTEFYIWQESNCEVCLHEMETCPILMICDVYNMEQFKSEVAKCILERFIPTEDGFPGTCKLLVKKPSETGLSEICLNALRIYLRDRIPEEDQIHCLKLIKQVEDEK